MAATETAADSAASTDVLPIVSYDSNTGFGGGVKSFFLNQCGLGESFDAVAFASSKGERWFRLVTSFPDIEHRQGCRYPAAFDASADYDYQNMYSFFGTGNRSSYQDRLYYIHEALDIQLTLSSGFSPLTVGQAAIHFRSVRDSGFPPGGTLAPEYPVNGDAAFRFVSFLTTYRYDSRASTLNPGSGCVILGEAERSIAADRSRDFTRLGATVQYYLPAAGKSLVFAFRGNIQSLICADPPMQLLLPIGGGTTVRGYVQDRYLDRTSSVLNFETRFPIIGRFSGMAGYDAGKVWHDIGSMDLHRWAINPVTGIRYSFPTFIARIDVGFGPEDMAVYLNFGQLF